MPLLVFLPLLAHYEMTRIHVRYADVAELGASALLAERFVAQVIDVLVLAAHCLLVGAVGLV